MGQTQVYPMSAFHAVSVLVSNLRNFKDMVLTVDLNQPEFDIPNRTIKRYVSTVHIRKGLLETVLDGGISIERLSYHKVDPNSDFVMKLKAEFFGVVFYQWLKKDESEAFLEWYKHEEELERCLGTENLTSDDK